MGVAVDSEGNIYVTDAMDYALKKFDAEGHLLDKSGGRGQGPGEFAAPRLLDSFGEFLFVTEQYQPVIKVFDRDLAYKFHIPVDGPVGDIKALGEDRVAVALLSHRNESRIHIYDRKGRIVRNIDFAGRSSPLLMDMVSFECDSRGRYYAAYNFVDRIVSFDASGQKLWSRDLLGIEPAKREKVSSFVVPTEIVYKDAALDRSGNLYVLGGKFSKNRSRDVFVLNPEGELWATLTLPEASHCIHIDGKDFLYARANEGVTLKKYRMTAGPPER